MATITKFEDLEIWQLARLQTNDFDKLVGSNGEFRSQLYRCLGRKHIIQERFDDLYAKNVALGNKLMSFICCADIL